MGQDIQANDGEENAFLTTESLSKTSALALPRSVSMHCQYGNFSEDEA